MKLNNRTELASTRKRPSRDRTSFFSTRTREHDDTGPAVSRVSTGNARRAILEQVTESFNISEWFFNCVVLDSQPTKSVPRRLRLAIERNIDEICPNRNHQSRLQRENLDVRSVGTTRPLRGVAFFDETCGLTDADAQEATVRACRSVNPGRINLGTPELSRRTSTLCTWQHERGSLHIMIPTDSEDALSEEHYLALKTLQRN